MAKIKLGRRYEEVLHGVSGVAVAVSQHLTGCDRVQLRTLDAKGNQERYVFDDKRLKLLALVPGEDVVEHTSVKTKLKLGTLYQDRTTGLCGHCIVITETINGNEMTATLEYKDKDGKIQDIGCTESMLTLVKPVVAKPVPQTKKERTSGPCGHARMDSQAIGGMLL